MPHCAICLLLSIEPRTATGTVGLLTRERLLVDAALERLGADADEQHVVVQACPEHVVDVYRGRIGGVRMAWLGDGPSNQPRRNPATTSASPA